MPHVVYNLDNAISNFFSQAGTSSSRAHCDEFVYRKYGGQVRPVDIQGLTSYTVIAGPDENTVVQFREHSALLDMNMMALAKEIHGDVVPDCFELGAIGDLGGPQLMIYEMNKLVGQNFITARSSLTSDQHLNTVNTLARFFAQSWNSGSPAGSFSVDKATVSAECNDRFRYLAEILPQRFQAAVSESQAVLSELCEEQYPVVITHSDFNEMNMLEEGVVRGLWLYME